MSFERILFFVLALSTAVPEAEMKKTFVNFPNSQYQLKATLAEGHPVRQSDLPFLVTIKVRVNSTNDTDIYFWKSICGGNIIGPLKILAAAHCFDRHSFNNLRDQNRMMIVAGEIQNAAEHSIDPSTEGTSQWREVADVSIHAKYQFPFFDIALVTLDTPVTFDYSVNKVDIARRTMDYPHNCRTAGYRRLKDRYGSQLPVLMVGEITPMPRGECRKLWGDNMRMFICTLTTIPNVSLAESGGPLFCQKTLDKAETPGKDLLVGMFSWKKDKTTTLFTRLSTYADWISKSSATKLKSCVFIVIMPLIL